MEPKQMSRKPTSLYDQVIFDMDGVLIDSIEIWIQIGLDGLKEHNITATREQMIKGIVKFTSLEKLGVPDLLAFGERINTLFCERVLETKLQKNILPVLKSLKQEGKNLSVLTTSGRVAVDSILSHLEIKKYFDTVITFDDVVHHKPDPEGVHAILKKSGISADRTLIVGDTRNDILAGKAAGISTVMYYPEIHEEIYDRDHLLALNADYYIRDLLSVLSICGIEV
jgi:pyrophosphatase PpaX